MRCYWTDISLMNEVPAYQQYNTVRNEPVIEAETYDVEHGISVRSVIDAASLAFSPMPVDQTGLLAAPVTGRLPCIFISGMSAATNIEVKVVYHYQLRFHVGLPFSVPRAIYEPEFESLKAYINGMPFITDGHSFASFFKSVFSGIKKAFRFVSNITEKVSSALPIVGGIIGKIEGH
jgi:hypothetical protein